MHKKVQSLLITGVLSANMIGSTVAVFADDIKKENGTKVEEATKPNGENIDWEKTTKSNYTQLWKIKLENDDKIVLEQYIGGKKNIEIPRKIGNKKVELNTLDTNMFPKVERIRVEDGEELIGLNQKDLEFAFAENENLRSLDLRGIDVSKVTNLSRFLVNSKKIEYVNLSGWDLSNVTGMTNAFYGLKSLETLDSSGWKTSDKLINTANMFYECSSLKSIDLSGFNMNKVTTTKSMFQKCYELTEIKGTEKWTLENVTDIGLMFKDTKLNFIDFSNVKLPEKETLPDYNMKGVFGYTDNNKKLLIATNNKRLEEYNYDDDKIIPFTLTFNTNEGNFKNGKKIEKIERIIINTEKLELLRKPIRDKYTFDNWGELDSNNTLNAKWKPEVKPEENPNKPGGDTVTPEENPNKPGGDTVTPEENPNKPGGDTVTPEENPNKPGGDTVTPEENPNKPGGDTVTPEENPNKPGGDTVTPEENPNKPGGDTVTPEENPNKPGGDTVTPEENPNKPGGDTVTPEENPNKPGGDTVTPEENPNKPGGDTVTPEENPNKPGDGTNNDNTTVEPPVLDGTDKDNIMIHPIECLPSVYTLVDENMVSITQRGDGTENNPVILQVKDSIYKVDLDHFINKFDTLNSNVSTITRSDKYTEYKMTVDNKNLNDPTKSKTTNVILRINNTKIDLLKAANRYSRRRNYDVKIPIIVKFSDVKDNFWGRSYIEDFASMGIVDGYPNNEFKPNNSITRAEFVRIINNAFGYTKPIDNVKFNDVEKNSWYYNDIAIALKQGYINGRSETTFSPNDNITREEVAMMLTNIMNNKDNDFNRLNSFNDGNKTSDWAKAAVAGAIKAGYLIGDDQKNLSPTKNMTRAEAIASLSRVRPVK